MPLGIGEREEPAAIHGRRPAAGGRDAQRANRVKLPQLRTKVMLLTVTLPELPEQLMLRSPPPPAPSIAICVFVEPASG